MSDTQFDPYRKWFGISTGRRPPSHYELLGVDAYESKTDVLEDAIGRRVEFLQAVSNGEHVAVAQRMLNEIAQARLCLLDVAKKKRYDEELQVAQSSQQNPAPRSVPGLSNDPIERPKPKSATKSATSHKRAPRGNSKSSNTLVPAVCGALAAVVISVVVLFFMFGGNKDLSQKSDGILPESDLPASMTIESSNQKPKRKKTASKKSGSLSRSDAGVRLLKKLELDEADLNAAIPRQGLTLWLDADAPEALVMGNGKSVVGWLDKSGNGFNMVQSKASNQPALGVSTKFHGKRALKFVAKDKMFLEMKNDAKFALKDCFTIVLVSHGAKGVLMSDGVPSDLSQNGFTIRESNAFRFIKVDGKYVDFFAANDSPHDPNVRILSVNESQPQWHSESGSVGEYRKGQRRATLDPSSVKLNVLNSDALRIGARPDKNRQYFEGEIAEVLIYNRLLTPEEMTELTSHLRSKWVDD